MRRRSIRPFGATAPTTKLWSMVIALALLWMLYDRMRDPVTWQWFSPHDSAMAAEQAQEPRADQAVAPAANEPPPSATEEIVPGPNDLDENQIKEAKVAFEGVVDKVKILSRDMDAYWMLMRWARTSSSTELEKRAARDVAFTQLFDQPDKFRGKLIHLKMHVRRVLVHEDPENELGLKKVYEIWGWTDESKSFPYVVVVPEIPKALPVGTDIRSEVIFTGYFLKVMAYQAFEAKRGSPLLVGRVRMAAPRPVAQTSKVDPMITLPAVAGVGIALIAFLILTRKRSRQVISTASLPENLPGIDLPGDLARGVALQEDSNQEFINLTLDSNSSTNATPQSESKPSE